MIWSVVNTSISMWLAERYGRMRSTDPSSVPLPISENPMRWPTAEMRLFWIEPQYVGCGCDCRLLANVVAYCLATWENLQNLPDPLEFSWNILRPACQQRISPAVTAYQAENVRHVCLSIAFIYTWLCLGRSPTPYEKMCLLLPSDCL